MTRDDRELERFQRDTEKHEMTILHDDGVYRHVRFKEPGTGFYWFDLITSPGLLTIHGDMGTYVFSRITDMFDFFHDNGYGINPQYWGEKLQASRHGGYREHSEDDFRRWVKDDFHDRKDDYSVEDAAEIWAAIRRDILEDDWLALSQDEVCRRALDVFSVKGFTYTDTWETDWQDYTAHYLWICQAIMASIAQYKASLTKCAISKEVADV